MVLLSAVILNAQSQYTYTAFGVPGGSDTYATGISGTNIVGYYDSSTAVCGYLYNGSSYTTLSVPEAQATYAYGICSTNIVGYFDDTNGITHGFLYNGACYATLDVPCAIGTYANGICGTNIVGYYDDTNGIAHGFLYNGMCYATLDVPGAQATYANGVSCTNIVGYYDDTNGSWHGFIYSGSNYTTLDFPGALATYVNGISGNNIVGYYQFGANYDGFLYNGGNFTTLYAPLADDTDAMGISGNSIVGVYFGDWELNYAEYPFLATLNSPLLQVEQEDGELILQWPTNYTDFTLQTTTNAFSPAAWTCYPATPIINGCNFNVTVTPDEAQRYFRLNNQPASGWKSTCPVPLDQWTFNQTLNDSGPGGNNLIATCCPGYVAGLNGFDAMSFNGTNQYVTSTNNLGITGLDFTFTGWASSSSDAADQNIFVWYDNAVGLYFIIGNGTALIGGTGETGWVSYGAVPTSYGPQSAWFFALVSTPTGYTCYTNGVMAGTGPPLFDCGANPIPTAPVRIGYTLNQGYTYALEGTVQDFRVYNTNLTASQVCNLYRAGAQ